MLSTNQNQGYLQLVRLLGGDGDFASLAKRHKLREELPELEIVRQELAHRHKLMQLISADASAGRELSDIIGHLPDPGMAHWDKTEVLALHELFELKSFLFHYLHLVAWLEHRQLQDLHPLPELKGLFDLLDPEGNALPVFRLSPRYSPKLQRLDLVRAELVQALQITRQKDLDKARKALRLPTLKEEFVLSRNAGEKLQLVMDSKHFVISAENLANYSFRLADSSAALKLKAKLNKLLQDIKDEEHAVQQRLTAEIKKQLPRLKQARIGTMEIVWDYLLADFGVRYACCIPEVYDPLSGYRGITIKQGINLPLKLNLEEKQRQFQALDLNFYNRISVITGPNMGGKSTILQTLALFCQSAARGMPVPAKKAMLPLYHNIYYNHDSGEHSETLSSFGREVVAFTLALKHPGSTLILLDEFAKGTNPEEGEALSLATIKYLQDGQHTLVAATHFSAPAKLKGVAHYSIRGLSSRDFAKLEKFPADDLKERLAMLSRMMDYSLVELPEGSEPPRCALQIASLLGLPEGILKHARTTRKKS